MSVKERNNLQNRYFRSPNLSFKLAATIRSNLPEVFLGKRCCKNMQQIYRRTPMPKCDFNKVAKQLRNISVKKCCMCRNM